MAVLVVSCGATQDYSWLRSDFGARRLPITYLRINIEVKQLALGVSKVYMEVRVKVGPEIMSFSPNTWLPWNRWTYSTQSLLLTELQSCCRWYMLT